MDPEVVLRKGKASKEEESITKPGNPPYPSVGAPFSPPQLFDRPVSAVSRFLNFGSVLVEFSSPGLGLEGQDFVTPLSFEVVHWHRPSTSKDFPTSVQGGEPAD
jgi:hypothetical protein